MRTLFNCGQLRTFASDILRYDGHVNGGGGGEEGGHTLHVPNHACCGKESLPQLFLAVAGTTWHFARFVSVLMKRESYCMLDFRRRESSETF